MARDPRFDVRKDPAEFPLRIDNVRLSVGKGSKAGNAEGGPVCLGDLSSLVAQHEKVELFLRAELGVLFDGIDADADNLGVELAVAVEVALEAPSLQRAAGSKGAGVKVEDGPLAVLHEAIEGDQAAAPGVGEFEIGGFGATGRNAGGLGRGECLFGSACQSGNAKSGDGSGFDKGPARRYRFGGIVVFVAVVVGLLHR